MPRRRHASPQTRKLLATLLAEPSRYWYGYELSRGTGLKSGTLYPILMRLKEQGFLVSEWQEPTEKGRPPRHMYQLSASGIELAERQRKDTSEHKQKEQPA